MKKYSGLPFCFISGSKEKIIEVGVMVSVGLSLGLFDMVSRCRTVLAHYRYSGYTPNHGLPLLLVNPGS